MNLTPIVLNGARARQPNGPFSLQALSPAIGERSTPRLRGGRRPRRGLPLRNDEAADLFKSLTRAMDRGGPLVAAFNAALAHRGINPELVKEAAAEVERVNAGLPLSPVKDCSGPWDQKDNSLRKAPDTGSKPSSPIASSPCETRHHDRPECCTPAADSVNGERPWWESDPTQPQTQPSPPSLVSESAAPDRLQLGEQPEPVLILRELQRNSVIDLSVPDGIELIWGDGPRMTEHLRTLATYCWRLSGRGHRQFGLGCEEAGKLLGVSKFQASRLIKKLMTSDLGTGKPGLGVIQRFTYGTPKSGKVSEYQWRGITGPSALRDGPKLHERVAA